MASPDGTRPFAYDVERQVRWGLFILDFSSQPAVNPPIVEAEKSTSRFRSTEKSTIFAAPVLAFTRQWLYVRYSDERVPPSTLVPLGSQRAQPTDSPISPPYPWNELE
jgi:hypothetical protein